MALLKEWEKDPSGPIVIYSSNQFLPYFLPDKWYFFYEKKRKATLYKLQFGENLEERLSGLIGEGDLFAAFKLIVITGTPSREEIEFVKRSGSSESADFLIISDKKITLRGARFYNLNYEPTRGEIEALIKYVVSLKGGEITDEAVTLLGDYIGGNLIFLEKEIDKLLSFNEDGRIDVVAVNSLSIPVREENIFKLTDAISRRDVGMAVEVASNLLEKDSPLRVLRVIYSHFHRIVSIKVLMKSGKSAGEIQKLLGMKDFYFSRMLNESTRFSLSDLEKILKYIDETELEIKLNRRPPTQLVDNLILRFADLNPTGSPPARGRN